MRCTLYIPGLWRLGILPRFSGYVMHLILLICLGGLAIIAVYTYTQAWNIQVESDRLKGHPLATKKVLAAEETDMSNTLLNYGIIIDCGSSGSRMFVYFWPPHDGSHDELLNIQLLLAEEGKPVVKKVEPGISTFGDRPSEASEYLRPLLQIAADHIPKHKHKETPLYILATAGMRLLPERDQKAIIGDLLVDIPSWFNFLFTETHAEVISGKQEGVYAWVATNYAFGKFDHRIGNDELTVVEVPGSDKTHIRKRTIGILDMGGGSLQVAFEVPKSVKFDYPQEEMAKNLLAEFSLGCTKTDLNHHYRVYITTFLGFGGNVARQRYVEMLVENSPSSSFNSSQSVIMDPCLPVDMIDDVIYRNQKVSLKGSGNYQDCRDSLQDLLYKATPCMKEPCSINGTYQPYLDFHRTEFVGFSEYFYTMEDIFRIGGKYDFYKFQMAAKDYCSTSVTTIDEMQHRKVHPRADHRRYKYQCFKSAWVTTVLHDGLHFPKFFKALTSLEQINGREIHWTLGALLYKTKYYPLRDMEMQKSHHYSPPWLGTRLPHTYLLPVICISIVVIAIVVYLRRLRIVPRSAASLRRVPTMSYFMTDEGQETTVLTDEESGLSFPYPNQYMLNS